MSEQIWKLGNKKLVEISNTMSDATRKTRTIERKLKNVEALPVSDEAAFSDMLPSLNDSGIDEDVDYGTIWTRNRWQYDCHQAVGTDDRTE